MNVSQSRTEQVLGVISVFIERDPNQPRNPNIYKDIDKLKAGEEFLLLLREIQAGWEGTDSD